MKKFTPLEIIRSIIFDIYIVVSTISLYAACFPFLIFGHEGARISCKLWALNVMWSAKYICGVSYQIKGTVPNHAAVFASKHQSAWETAFFYVVTKDPSYVLKKQLMYIPVFNLFLIVVGHIAIDRSTGASALKKLVKDVKDRIGKGRSVVIFPEGTRKQLGEPTDYKPGISAIYSMLKDVPIVPVRLNSGLLWPKGAHIKKTGVITIEFMPEIERGLSRNEFMAKLESVIEAPIGS